MEAWFIYTAALPKAYFIAHNAAFSSLNFSLNTSTISFKYN